MASLQEINHYHYSMAGLGTKIYNNDYVQEQLKTLNLGEDLEAVTAEIAKATDTGTSIDITEGGSQAPRSDEEMAYRNSTRYKRRFSKS